MTSRSPGELHAVMGRITTVIDRLCLYVARLVRLTGSGAWCPPVLEVAWSGTPGICRGIDCDGHHHRIKVTAGHCMTPTRRPRSCRIRRCSPEMNVANAHMTAATFTHSRGRASTWNCAELLTRGKMIAGQHIQPLGNGDVTDDNKLPTYAHGLSAVGSILIACLAMDCGTATAGQPVPDFYREAALRGMDCSSCRASTYAAAQPSGNQCSSRTRRSRHSGAG
jgi:hypothetical protein